MYSRGFGLNIDMPEEKELKDYIRSLLLRRQGEENQLSHFPKKRTHLVLQSYKYYNVNPF